MSNFGQIALSIVGAVIGYVIGGPYGAAIGLQIGYLGSTFLFPTQLPPVTGPRLTDHATTTASVGDPVIIGYGTFPSTGTVIFLDKIVEHATTTTQGGGGKGAPQQSSTTYSYTQSIGIGLCEGPILGIRRIWENGELVYDSRPLQPGETTLQFSKRTAVSTKYAGTFVLYLGDDEQGPDPTIELVQGLGNTPYFRGLAYVVYPDRKLRSDQGLRHPSFKFEVVKGGAPLNGAIAPVWLGGTAPVGGWSPSIIAIDWTFGRYYIMSNDWSGSISQGTISGFTILDNKEFARVSKASLGAGNLNIGGYGLAVSPDGNVLFCAFESLSTGGIWVLNPANLSVIAHNPTVSQLGWMRFAQAALLSGFAGQPLYMTAVVPVTFQDHIAIILGDESVWQILSYGGRKTCVAGTGKESSGDILFYTTADNSTDIQIYAVRVTMEVILTTMVPVISQTLLRTVTPSQLDATWTGFVSGPGGPAVGDLTCDPADGTVVFMVNGSGGVGGSKLVKINPTTGTVIWAVPINSPGADAYSQNIVGTSRVYQMELSSSYSMSTGSATALPIAADLATLGSGITTFGAASSSAGYGAGIMMTSIGPVVFLLGHIGDGNVPIADIIQDLCTRSGLYDIGYSADTTSITTTIPGFTLASTPMAARDAIVPLRSVGFFDACESGDILRFVARGGSIARSLTTKDLGAFESGTSTDPAPANSATLSMESDVPQQIRVTYMAVSRDYQQGEQLSPSRYATKSANPSDVQLGGVCLGDDQAAQCAEILWNDAWESRHTYNFAVDMSNADLETTDVITVPLQGSVYRVRITSLTDASQVLRTIVASSDDDGNYVSSAVGQPPDIITTIKFAAPTNLIMLDTPLLRDQDDTGRVTAPLYGAVYPVNGDSWTGAAVYDSTDSGVTYGLAMTDPNATSVGVATTALGPTDNPFVTDTSNTITVQMQNGAASPSSITDGQLLTGGNASALIDSDGSVEIFQFRDAILVSDGVYTLSHLYRGRRGTDTMTNGHDVGSTFVQLSASAIGVTDMALAELDKSLSWKALGVGDTLADVAAITFTDKGRSLMPYAPVNLHAFVDPNSTIFVTAKRRSRIGAPNWVDQEGASLALAEDYEEYEMDVYDPTGVTVLRTLTSTSLPVVYPSLYVVADFTSVPSSIIVALYQISGEVGRGFGEKTTLTVNPTTTYAPLDIITINLNGPIVGVMYSVTFNAAGGQLPYAWSMLSAAPNTGNWMTLTSSANQGHMDGTPTVNETEVFTIQVRDSLGTTVSATYSISVTGGSSSGSVSGGGGGGSGSGGTTVTGTLTGAPYIGGVHNAGDQSYGWDTTPGIVSYATAAPGTDAYAKTQDLGSYDVVWGLGGGFESFETSTRKKQDLITTVKGRGSYPNIKNASRTPYVFAYCIMESGKNVSSGSGYDRWIGFVRSKNWWAYVSPGGSGTLLGAGAGGYCQINYTIAWPNAIVSVPKDGTIAGAVYGSLLNGRGPSRTAARYFGSALLISVTNVNLDSNFTGLTNGASPDIDGLYLDNSFTSPDGGGALSSSTASWDGIGTQSNSAEAAYPSGVSSLLARGQWAFWDELQSYLALCNPGRKYLSTGNAGEYFANIDAVPTITANAMAGVLSGMTVEEAFGTGGASLQSYKTFAQMRDAYYKTMDFLAAPKLLGLVIRLPAKDGSKTASWKIDGVLTTVYADTLLEYQSMRTGLCFTLLENGIATFACYGYDYTKYRWYDESGDDSLTQVNVHRGYMGKRVGNRPTAAAFANGMWLVEYENAISLFNPWGNGHQLLTLADIQAVLPGEYQCLHGTQCPSVNTGAAFTSRTFGDPDGQVLLKKNPLKITVGSLLQAATVGQLYQAALTATGGTPPYVWAAVSITPNTGSQLSINSNGTVQGTPTTAETETIVVKVTDATNTSVSANTSVVVNAAGSYVVSGIEKGADPGLIAFVSFTNGLNYQGGEIFVVGETGSAEVEFERVYGATGTISITVTTFDSINASAGIEYTTTNTTLTWTDGDVSRKSVTIPVLAIPTGFGLVGLSVTGDAWRPLGWLYLRGTGRIPGAKFFQSSNGANAYGDTSGSGTLLSPWKSVAYAISQMGSSGGVLYWLDVGPHMEWNGTPGSGDGVAVSNIAALTSSPLIVMSDPANASVPVFDQGATIGGAAILYSNATGFNFEGTGANVWIVGLHLKRCNVTYYNAVQYTHPVVWQCEIETYAISGSNAAGIRLDNTTNLLAQDCFVHHIYSSESGANRNDQTFVQSGFEEGCEGFQATAPTFAHVHGSGLQFAIFNKQPASSGYGYDITHCFGDFFERDGGGSGALTHMPVQGANWQRQLLRYSVCDATGSPVPNAPIIGNEANNNTGQFVEVYNCVQINNMGMLGPFYDVTRIRQFNCISQGSQNAEVYLASGSQLEYSDHNIIVNTNPKYLTHYGSGTVEYTFAEWQAISGDSYVANPPDQHSILTTVVPSYPNRVARDFRIKISGGRGGAYIGVGIERVGVANNFLNPDLPLAPA